jgi:transcriptional regulator with XRE-family HTH domain
MRWDFGQVYKTIRTSKGLTQKQICGDRISRSTLARIEKGEIVPSFESMIFLLDQINMSLEEFRYVCHYYQASERQMILALSEKHTSVIDNTELIKLKELCVSYLKNHHDIPIEQLLDRLNIVIHVRKFGGYSQDEKFQTLTQKIWKNLEKQDTWYESDLKLLSNILFHFPLDSVKAITPQILDSLEKYKNFHNIKPLQYQLLTNLATIYLYNNLIKECLDITLITLELSQEIKRYDYLGFSQIRLGICRKDDDLIKKGIEILTLTNESTLLKIMKEEVKKFR